MGENMKKTIMIIDDEESMRDILNDIITEHGYNVILCKNGADGLQTYNNRQKEIDLVITDVMMPIMNGYEFFTQAKKINSQIKVIIMSGYSNKLAQEFIDEGALEFIQKPMRLLFMMEIIQKHIGVS